MVLRYRRYRVYIVFAVITIYAFYSFSGSGSWRGPRNVPVGKTTSGSAGRTGSSHPKEEPLGNKQPPAFGIPDLDDAADTKLNPPTIPTKSKPKQEVDDGDDEEDEQEEEDKVVGDDEEEEVEDEDKEEEEDEAEDEDEDLADTVSTIPTRPIGRPGEQGGQGRADIDQAQLMEPKIYWKPQKENYPLKTLTKVPTGRPKKALKIQYEFTKKETKAEKVERKKKLKMIVGEFEHAWGGYKSKAWMHDELTPVSGGYKDPFCGWAATLVDSLDSLWILGLKTEFESAVKAVGDIKFTTSPRGDIPVFETTIRYLGGLLGAYDISGGQYEILLSKAVELGDVLMGVFDTPNRMPEMYYQWQPDSASKPKRASASVVLAEIGSLSMEFTRLAQLTKQNRYYDAIARITDELEKLQVKTRVPGLWPTYVDASGCKKPQTQVAKSSSNAPDWALADDDPLKKSTKATKTKREPLGPFSKIVDDGTDADCVPTGLASGNIYASEKFTIGGLADSTYEYLAKEYLLLGGQNKQYRDMYEKAADAIAKNLVYRPMLPDKKLDLRFTGILTVPGYNPQIDRTDESTYPSLDPEGAHLTCFAGGMFGLGGKIFNRKEDLELAEKITNYCVWAYSATPTGIMPESFRTIPCEKLETCPWDEELYNEVLDPNSKSRQANYDSQLEHYQKTLKEFEDAEKEKTKESEVSKKKSTKDETSKEKATVETKEEVEQEEEEEEEEEEAEAEAEEEEEVDDEEEEDEDEEEEPPAAKIGKRQLRQTRKSTAKLDDEEEETEAEAKASAMGIYKPTEPLSHKEYAKKRIEEERLPTGFTSVDERKYILRPEALDSVFYRYRITGEKKWRDAGWKMFTAVQRATHTEHGNSAIADVTRLTPSFSNTMESFWLAETLKYFYLLFDDEDTYSLDDWVLNTEAHPFRRPDSSVKA